MEAVGHHIRADRGGVDAGRDGHLLLRETQGHPAARRRELGTEWSDQVEFREAVHVACEIATYSRLNSK